MDAGKIWKSEVRVEADRKTKVPVRRLTGYQAHSNHLYFTNPGWFDGGKRLLFMSDRNNRSNLFSVELSSGQITQMTSFPEQPEYPSSLSFLFTSLNPRRDEAYFWLGHELVALDLKTFHYQPIYNAPKNMAVNMTNVSADGSVVCTGVYEDLSKKFKVDLLNGYVGFEEYHAAKPLSQIVAIDTRGGPSKVVFEENYWIGHVNTSPTQAAQLSFCHEGPWNKVDCRMWGLDRGTGKVWKIRPTGEGENVGHEYWLADGVHLGYHGHTARGAIFGFTRFDNSEKVEALFPKDSTHFHSNGMDLIVGDGSRGDGNIYLWKFKDGQFSKPRILCEHRCSFQVQRLHVHPRFSPDGKYVLFTSDSSGYGNIYTVEVPPFESLPEA
jgi:oligogalacturonide lyase